MLASLAAQPATAKTVQESMGAELWNEAKAAYDRFADRLTNDT